METNKEIDSWLREYHNRITKRNMRLRIKDFLNSIGMSAEDFIKLSSKEVNRIIDQLNQPPNKETFIKKLQSAGDGYKTGYIIKQDTVSI